MKAATLPAPTRTRTVRPWLHGLLAALLALAATVAPAEHGRMMLGRAAAALAMAPGPSVQRDHGPHVGHDAPAGGAHTHFSAPTCLACVLMGAPGLPAAGFAVRPPRLTPTLPSQRVQAPCILATLAWAPHSPRAPPVRRPA